MSEGPQKICMKIIIVLRTMIFPLELTFVHRRQKRFGSPESIFESNPAKRHKPLLLKKVYVQVMLFINKVFKLICLVLTVSMQLYFMKLNEWFRSVVGHLLVKSTKLRPKCFKRNNVFGFWLNGKELHNDFM